MDRCTNPFSTDIRDQPPLITGRDSVLESVRISCRRAISGRGVRSIMLHGLRGIGKTALLNATDRIAQEEGLYVSKIGSPKCESLAHLLFPEMLRVLHLLLDVETAEPVALQGLKALRGFASAFKIEVTSIRLGAESEPGIGDSGSLENDLSDLFQLIGRAAKSANNGWAVLIDEVHLLCAADLAALIAAIHRIAQQNLPVLLVGAGLPQIARRAGNAKSYAERLFLYTKLGPLEPKYTREAIERPIVDRGASISPTALSLMVDVTHGYPFFFKEWASIAWAHAKGPEITIDDVNDSYAEALASLDISFYGNYVGQLNDSEIGFLKAMSSLSDTPYTLTDIAEATGASVVFVEKTCEKIISKGVMYDSGIGIDFTVPLLGEYFRRHVGVKIE